MGNSARRITLKDFYRLSERRMRISVDVDHGGLKVLRVFFAMKNLFPNCAVTTDRTRHGCHIKAVGEEIEKIPVSKRIDIRESLGDDPLRVEFDRIKMRSNRYYVVDTLFSMKRDYDGVLTIAEEFNPVALPWASSIPSKKTILR